MKRILMITLLGAFVLAPGSALAVEGDCNNDGQVDQADMDTLMASLNQPADQPGLANCDYNKDGGLGLDDVGTHLQAQPE